MIIHTVEQGSPEWFLLRAGKPTASDSSKLITSTGERSKSLEGYAITLAGEKYAGKPLDAFEGNSWTDRGKLLEDEARDMYAFLYDATPEKVGFVTDDEQKYGCSPDSMIGPDGMLEIKCLKAENHLKALLYYRKHKKCQPDYVQQTQGQIYVCERTWCDLYFYHPDLPTLVIRQERDGAIINCLKEQIDNVIIERNKVVEQLLGFASHDR
jgi:YqaJ-like viral recombinase domain